MTRARKHVHFLKWTGMVLSLLIVMAWAINLFCTLGYTLRDCCRIFSIQGSDFMYHHYQTPMVGARPGFWRAGRSDFMTPVPVIDFATYPYVIFIPLWMPLLLVGVPTAWLWYRYRHIPPHCCQKCRYNLTGNTSGVCPECGERI